MNKNVMAKVAKINKEELSAEKVELGAVQDFNKVADRLISGSKTLNKAAQEFVDDLSNFGKLQNKLDNSFGRAETFSDQIEDDVKLIQKLADDVAKMSKELGIQPKDTGININVVKIIDDIEDTISTVRKNAGDAKKIIGI
jgi:maltose-binding protein MalE